MVQTAADLQQLKGVGRILAKRLFDAGFDSFAKIAKEGEEGLQRVRGLSPRHLGSIVEQARQLSETAHPDRDARAEALQQKLSEVRDQVQSLAEQARQRFQQELSGKPGKKLTFDLVRIEDALARFQDGGKKSAKRAGRALAKAEKRVSGLENASLKKVRKRLRKARKAVLKAL